jgi:voltage-gated potassium channel
MKVLASVVRLVLVTGVLVAVYATAPLDRPAEDVAMRLLLGMVVVAVVLGVQLRSVLRSPHPTLRGIEAVAISITLLVLVSASAYFSIEHSSPGSFSEPLSRVDGAYFSVTVLTTVGFGDIAPTSQLARGLVTAQMLVNLVLVGFIAKVLVGAVRRRRDALGVGETKVSPAPEHG